MMNPPTKTGDIPTKAEFMIVLEWDKDSGADVDLWIQRDDEDPIGYKNKQSTLIHLDRDDLGHSTDTVQINGETKIVPINREVITIRGLVAGEYYVGLHYYREPANTANKSLGYPEQTATVSGTVTFMDVNPYREAWSQAFTMEHQGTKINLPAVTINDKGEVTAIYSHTKNLGPNSTVSEQDDNPEAYNYGSN